MEYVIDWIVFPSYKIHALKFWSQYDYFGDSAYKEVIKGKWGHKDGALNPQISVFIRNIKAPYLLLLSVAFSLFLWICHMKTQWEGSYL